MDESSTQPLVTAACQVNMSQPWKQPWLPQSQFSQVFFIPIGPHFPELLSSDFRAVLFCFWLCELFNHSFISFANFWTKIKPLCFAFLPLSIATSVSTQMSLFPFLKKHSSYFWISLIRASLYENFLAMKNYFYFRTTP